MSDISKILKKYDVQTIAFEIARRAKQLRIAQNLTQQMLAEKSGVSLGSVKRFECLGKVSLQNLLSIALILDALEEFSQLFLREHYSTLDEFMETHKAKTRKRARGK